MAEGDTVLVQLGDGITSPKVTIKITEDAFGNFKFDVTQSGPIVGDLQGIFFDVGGTGANGTANDALLASTADSTKISGLTATGSGALTNLASTVQDGNDSVKDLGNGNNMNGALGFNDTGAEAKGYDVGIGFGTSGIGKDDVRSVSFTFNNSIGLTIDDFIGMDFGVRMTSVGTLGGARDGSVKLTSSSFQPIADGDEDINCVLETESESGSVFDPEIEGAGGVTLTQTLSSFTLYDEGGNVVATNVFGTPINLPNSEGATITFNADGTYTVDSGSDALNADDHLPFTLSYTVHQTYTDSNGHVVGQLDDTSQLAFDICGVNDNPDAVNDDPDCILEDQQISGNVLTNDTDIDRGDSLIVTHVNGLELVDGVLEITLASGAKVTIHEDGSYLYDTNGAFLGLNDGEMGDDSFTYSVSDGHGGVDTATVDICIDGVSPPGGNEPPDPPTNPASALSHGYWMNHNFSNSEGFAAAVGATSFDDFFGIDSPTETTWTDANNTATTSLTDLSFLRAVAFGNGAGNAGDTMTPNPGTGYEGLVREAATAVLNYYDTDSNASLVEWYIYERNLHDNDLDASNNPTNAAGVLADLKAQVEATIEGADGAYTVSELEALLQLTHH